MKLTTLTEEQITSIYHTRMVHDFPPDERRMLRNILGALRRGEYECFGAEEDGDLIGYAFFAKTGSICLLDYLAVFPEKRNAGIGSSILALLHTRFADAACVFTEVEDPEFAEREEDRLLQDRRLHFYLRNGYRDTDVRVRLYGVNYRILAMDTGRPAEKDGVREAYRALYHVILPPDLYEKFVEIR